MNNTAYSEFINYADERIQQAAQTIVQFNDNSNLLEIRKEQLEFLLFMFNYLISHINNNNE